MKEYKIIPVPLSSCIQGGNEDHPSSVKGFVRELFFADEDTEHSSIVCEDAEKLMQKMNSEGWEVASTSACGTYPSDIVLFITFEREK